MSQPPIYTVTTNFADDAADQVSGRDRIVPSSLDAELANIATTVNATRTNLGVIQGDDTGLRSGVVTLSSLAAATKLLMTSGACTISSTDTAWVTATSYPPGRLVDQSGFVYFCTEQHTSGVFATDLAAGKWIKISSILPASAFIETLLDDVDAATARATLGLPASAFILTLIDDVDAATARSTLGAAASGAVGSSGLTTTTGSLLGRTTAATGAIENLVVTGPLALGANPGGTGLYIQDVTDKQMQNLSISAAVNGTGALVITLKGGDGQTLASPNVGRADFRASPNTDGSSVTNRTIEAASITIPSGAELGTADGVPSRIWVGLISPSTGGGTAPKLAVFNARNGSDIVWFNEGALVDTTLLDTSSDSAGVWYTANTGYSQKAINVLGYVESTQATKGSWLTAPTLVVSHPKRRPGDKIQEVTNVVTTAVTPSDTTAVSQADAVPAYIANRVSISKSVTPTNSANVLEIEHSGTYSSAGVAANMTIYLSKDGGTPIRARGNTSHGGSNSLDMSLKHRMVAGGTSSTTFSIGVGTAAGAVQCYMNALAGTRMFGGVDGSYLKITEIFA